MFDVFFEYFLGDGRRVLLSLNPKYATNYESVRKCPGTSGENFDHQEGLEQAEYLW